MDRGFMQPKTAWKRLKAAQEYPRNVYLYGVTGYGKTTLLDHFFEGMECERYSCRNGRLRKLPEANIQVEVQPESQKSSQTVSVRGRAGSGTVRQKIILTECSGKKPIKDERGRVLHTIVIDDLQFLKSSEDKEQILEWMEHRENWVVLSSRSPLLPWLKLVYMKQEIIVITAEELAWTEPDVKTYFDENKVKLTKEQAQEIVTYSQGNCLSIRYIAKLAVSRGAYEKALLEQSRHDFEDYIMEQLVEEWDSALLQFLMMMSFVDRFNVTLAEMVTGDTASYGRIKEAEEIGDFMTQDDDDFYQFRPLLRTALQRRARATYGSEKIRGLYYNIGLYYEVHDQVEEALTMYERSGNFDRIREILIRNALKNPGNGHYFELRKFYLAMPEEEIAKSPVLMAGMSMLHSLLLQSEDSEKWYARLREYEDKQTGAIGREAKARRIYLDIALPHRGSRGIQSVLNTVPMLMERQRIHLPEFSVTSNLPSVMNGGKDFCEWSKQDRTMAATLGKVLTIALGRYGKGLIDIALGESIYEKGGDDYEIIALLTKGAMAAESAGVIEMVYASIGVQVRLNLVHGNEEAALNILNGFAKKAEKEQAREILKNLDAQRCRIALYGGNHSNVEAWIEQGPDEEKEFFVLERYRYLTKVRCYIWQGEYYRALALLEKLKIYAEQHHRVYIQIETTLLLAMIQFRMKKEEWRYTLLEAVKGAEEYSFYRIITEEGNAIWQMLSDEMMKKKLLESCQEQYVKKLLEDTHSMALYFPMYLVMEPGERQEFKGNALEILRLQAEGLTNEQIASCLGIKEETVRYHNKQNYRKLGVEGRAEAVIQARKLRIL